MSGTGENKAQTLHSRGTIVWEGLPLSKQEMTTQCTEYYVTGKYKVLWDTTRWGTYLDLRGQGRLSGEEVLSELRQEQVRGIQVKGQGMGCKGTHNAFPVLFEFHDSF